MLNATQHTSSILGLDYRGRILQVMALVAGGFALALLLLVLASSDRTALGRDLAVLGTLLTICGTVWFFARQGHIAAGAHILFVTLALLTLAASLDNGATSAAVPTLFLPIVGATLLLQARYSFAYAGLALVVYLALNIFDAQSRPAGFAELVGQFGVNTTLYIAYFFITALLSYLAADKLTRALEASRNDNAQLNELRDSLEQQVAARTASLQAALSEVKERETRLATALSDLEASEATIRELSAPVIPVLPGVLVMPLSGAVDSRRAEVITQQALQAVEERAARQIVFDVTGVPVIDTQVAQLLLRTAAAVRLLGAQATLVGIRPEVAQTLVALQVDLTSIRVGGDLQQALMGSLKLAPQRNGFAHALYAPARA